MENAGAVTILEDYVFRSKVTDAAYERGPRRSCTSWRTCGSAISSPCAGGTTCGSTSRSRRSRRSSARPRPRIRTNAWTTFANVEKTWAYRQDQLPSTHPISADIRDIEDVEVNFDGITYAKGASVLKQLVAWVGRDAFVAGVRAYFERHAWGNTELVDLLAALEETSGRDLSSWAKEWLETAGLNTLRASSRSTQPARSPRSTLSRSRRTIIRRCGRIAWLSGSTTAMPMGLLRRTVSSSTWWVTARQCLSWSASGSPTSCW